MRKCPTCAAALHRTDFMCRACGHVLEEVVAVKYVFQSADDVRTHFGKFPTFESVFLPVEEPLPEGTLVGLRLILPAPWGEMTIPSRVTAMARTPSTPATPYRLQMTLLQVDREKEARLKALIAGESAPPGPRVAPPPSPPAPPPAVIIDDRTESDSYPAYPPPPAASPPEPSPPPAPPTEAELDLDLEELLRPPQRAWWPPAPPGGGAPGAAESAAPAKERLPEHTARLLTDFVMHLTRAVVKSSYYEPDHQAAMQAKVGLYDIFKMLVVDSYEITFLNESTETRRSVMVHGILDEPTDLERVMLKGQAELFGHKLATYMESKALLGISFKRSLDHGEFHRFIDLLGTPAHTTRGPADFANALVAQRVRNISVIFKSDLLSKRKLSWRVALALTRLKKDLSVLPLYEGLGGDELRAVRHQVFRDVIRPLCQVPLIRELLLNCDLVAAEVPELSQEEIEILIDGAVTAEMLPDLLGRLTQDTIEAVHEKDPRSADLVRLTRNLARMLAASQRDLKEQVFRQLFDNGIVSVEDLPPALQDKVAVERKTDKFLEHWSDYLQTFDHVSEPTLYQRHLDLFLLILPELISRHELDVASRISLLVAKHRVVRDGFPTRAAMAGVWLTGLGGSSTVATEFIWQLMSTDKVRREGILVLCGILGEGAVPILFKALNDCPTRSIRLELCDMLVSLKEQTARYLSAELEKKTNPWYFQRNLLNLMGRVGGPDDLPLVGHFLSDMHPRVRLEALLSVCALDPSSAERMLVWGLADLDPDVRGVSIRQLVQRRSTAQELFDNFRAVLWATEDLDEEKARQVCGLLASYQAGEGHEQAVDLLLGVLEEDRKKGFWARISTPLQADAIKVLACQTLGRLRAKRAVGLLTRLAEGKNRALRQSAVQALRFIQQSERV